MGRNNKCKYRKNRAFSFKERGQHGIRKSYESSFYNRKEWLETYDYGKGMFYSEYGDELWRSASIFSNKFANILVEYF